MASLKDASKLKQNSLKHEAMWQARNRNLGKGSYTSQGKLSFPFQARKSRARKRQEVQWTVPPCANPLHVHELGAKAGLYPVDLLERTKL